MTLSASAICASLRVFQDGITQWVKPYVALAKDDRERLGATRRSTAVRLLAPPLAFAVVAIVVEAVLCRVPKGGRLIRVTSDSLAGPDLPSLAVV